MKNSLYWSYNLPLQAWPTEDGTVHILNYMARKERCVDLEFNQAVLGEQTKEEFFETAAQILENLARLMREFGQGKIDHVYYPDKGYSAAETPEKGEGTAL